MLKYYSGVQLTNEAKLESRHELGTKFYKQRRHDVIILFIDTADVRLGNPEKSIVQ